MIGASLAALCHGDGSAGLGSGHVDLLSADGERSGRTICCEAAMELLGHADGRLLIGSCLLLLAFVIGSVRLDAGVLKYMLICAGEDRRMCLECSKLTTDSVAWELMMIDQAISVILGA